MKRCVGLFLILLSLVGASAAEPEIEITFSRTVLENGLTVIIHEDHKAPIVAVNVWYHVGSKDEKPGRTGFAHLFEHLMFNGSEHFNDDWFRAIEKVGATGANGTTSEDRTNYFEVVPKEALDYALWLESDRMGHLLGVMDQARLDEQRGVVQNEKREGENQPYGKDWNTIVQAVYPIGHPYSWPVIGSMEDLNAASLDDVRNWFKTHYGAANATVVVAGDVDTAAALALVKKNFGDIPAGPPTVRTEEWIAKRTGPQRQMRQDRVPNPKIYQVWNVPPYRAADATLLDLAADVLTSGKTSRLYKRLVYDEQIATSVAAYNGTNEIGGLFIIEATAKPGHHLGEIEKAIDEELDRFLAEGPTEAELERNKIKNLARFIRGIERIGGWGGKGDVLAESEVMGGRADFYQTRLERLKTAKPQAVQAAAKRWLSDGEYVLEVQPFPEYQTAKAGADRSKLPVPDLQPNGQFPELQRTTLSNGLKVILAERHAAPLVDLRLMVQAGSATDAPDLRGRARLATDLLDEGTALRSALEINDQTALLGANLRTWSDLDTTNVQISMLTAKLDPALALFGDVVLHPAFPASEFERLSQEQLDAIRAEKSEPDEVAMRIFPGLVFGREHPYGGPWSGLGMEETVRKLTRDDAVAFHQQWFRPDNATLIVVGDTTLAEIKPKLEKLFANWQRGEVPNTPVATVERPAQSLVYLIDRPGSIQSTIVVGGIAPPRSSPDELALAAMSDVLGGAFTSRINMNLREDKHWSYGARSEVQDARGPRAFVVSTSVQTDRTADSVGELARELREILGARPVTTDELAKVQQSETLSLPGQWETSGQVTGAIADLVRYRLLDDYYTTYARKVRQLTAENLNAAASEVIHPEQLVWVLVGDRAKIEAELRTAGIGDVQIHKEK